MAFLINFCPLKCKCSSLRRACWVTLYDQNNYFGDFPDFSLQDELAKMTLINIGIYQRMKFKVKKKIVQKWRPLLS